MQVLYRKYRPQNFKEVVGQDHVITALQGSIDNGTIAHAYLFCGTRGTGKTSIARIFARALGTSENDIYEIDAASNTGVDNIKELNESVFTLPFESKYKIYILDEAHMLSKSAWNAFLKTLEEPPAHVIFILATTEMHKVPETILSRCQVFNFKKPSRAVLRTSVEHVAKAEGYKLEEGVSELVATFGDGSFRDAYGSLQKIIGISKDKKISLTEAEAVTGAPRDPLILEIVEALAKKNKEQGMKALREVSSHNVDPKILLELVLERVRFVLLLSFDPASSEFIKQEVSDSAFDKIKTLASDPTKNITSKTLIRLLEAHADLSRSPIPELALELALIDLL